MLAVLMLAVLLVSCGGGNDVAAPQGMQLASLDVSPYYLFIPAGWVVSSSPANCGGYTSDGSNVYVSSFASANIGAEEETTPLGTESTPAKSEATTPSTEAAQGDKTSRELYIDAYWEMCWKTYTKELSGFSVIEDGTKTTFGSLDAKQYVYTAKIDGKEYKLQMTVTYSGGLIYVMTYTAKKANFDTHLDTAKKILSEFKFK